MITYLNNFVNKINTLKYYLLGANILLVSGLILFSNGGYLPLQNMGDFFFFAFIVFIFALYRPGWGFLFFVGSIMLENINLAPESLGIMIRPYQLIGFLTFLAVGVRYFSKRLNFSLPGFIWADYVLALFSSVGFLSALTAADTVAALKQSIIIVSFFILYLLTRIFIQSLADVKKIIPFFLSSSLVVLLYGIWQNWRFLAGQDGFEVMPGRANATFSEPDWWGIFLTFLLSILFVLIYNLTEKIKLFGIKNNKSNIFYSAFVWFLIFLSATNLIISVARSAWVASAFLLFVFVFYLSLKKKIRLMGGIVLVCATSLGAVHLLKLTNFELTDRLQSTQSGNQEITIACREAVEIISPIESVEFLTNYNCEHINLEEIEAEMREGKIIQKIYRKDPNIDLRSKIYEKTWEQIRAHWFLGIGWGNISKILGNDERGSGLNTSNIFLEVWLGSGFLGLISFLTLIGYAIGRGKMFFWKKFRGGKFQRGDAGMDFFYLFLVLSSAAIIVPNLFNAGIMLGFLWFWLGLIFIKN